MNTLIKAPLQPAPLSSSNTYTTWPGGVDPSTPLFNTDNQKGGKKSRKVNRKKSRKVDRKKTRKVNLKKNRK